MSTTANSSKPNLHPADKVAGRCHSCGESVIISPLAGNGGMLPVGDRYWRCSNMRCEHRFGEQLAETQMPTWALANPSQPL